MNDTSAKPSVVMRGAQKSLSIDALHELLDGTSSVIAVKDLEGRYLYVNRAFVDLKGGAAVDYLGRTDLEIFDAEMASQVRENDRQVLAAGHEMECEERLTLNGEERIYQVHKYPLFDENGDAWGLSLRADDRTDTKRTEDALRSIALGISAATGPEVFDLTVCSVASALGVDLAFVAALEGEAPDARLQTLAVCSGGSVGGSVCYPVLGTPCATVLRDGFQFYSGTATGLFPDDPMLVDDAYDSYAGYPLLDAAGRPAGVLSICHRGPLPRRTLVETILNNFSVRAGAELERMRMDRALLETEQSYRTIFESSEDCIFVHDIDTGAIVDVNPRACEVYGYDYDTLLTLRAGDLSTGEPPYTEADAAAWIARARAGEVIRVEWHRRNADGSAHWDEVVLKRVQLAGVDRILAVTREITERKVREQALARSEDRLRATVEGALDCIIIMDSAGRVLEFNPAAEATFRYKRGAVIGRPLAELIIPERFRRAHEDGMARHRLGGDGVLLGRRSEMVALRADGTEFPVELAIGVAEGVDGKVFIGYLRDITEREEAERARGALEAQLRQAQKMEAIGHLTGGIAHDFNNILTGIMGYIVMASEAARGSGDARLQQYLQRAHYSSARATELIQQMLTFSRGQRSTLRPVAPDAVVGDTLKLVHATLSATVQVRAQFAEPLPDVMADPVQLEQVLMNLCINSRDAMNNQGELAIEVRAVDVDGAVCVSCQQTVRGRFVDLSTTDNGPGISTAVMERMFEPFFSTKQPGQGSGMGLATVHGIVHEHKGHILVTNVERGGACFRILLPAVEHAEVIPPTVALQDRSHATSNPQCLLDARVLLVDDDESARTFMQDLLADWGLTVDVYAAPSAARGAADDGTRWDLAILDYTMPEMTGLELAAALRRHSPGLEVLLYSGYAEGLSSEQLEAAGVRTLLRKPVDTVQLYRAIETALAAQAR
jgi:PAS domain S-box-containing protein